MEHKEFFIQFSAHISACEKLNIPNHNIEEPMLGTMYNIYNSFQEVPQLYCKHCNSQRKRVIKFLQENMWRYLDEEN